MLPDVTVTVPKPAAGPEVGTKMITALDGDPAGPPSGPVGVTNPVVVNGVLPDVEVTVARPGAGAPEDGT